MASVRPLGWAGSGSPVPWSQRGADFSCVCGSISASGTFWSPASVLWSFSGNGGNSSGCRGPAQDLPVVGRAGAGLGSGRWLSHCSLNPHLTPDLTRAPGLWSWWALSLQRRAFGSRPQVVGPRRFPWDFGRKGTSSGLGPGRPLVDHPGNAPRLWATCDRYCTILGPRGDSGLG